MTKKYKHVVVGGTFDRLHVGHEKILETAFKNGEKVTIGLTTESLHKGKHFFHLLESFEHRQNNLLTFLKKQKLIEMSEIMAIDNMFGNTLTDESVEAIVVSLETQANALLINQKRREKGWKELDIIMVKDILGDDDRLVASGRIRAGETDRKGQSYINFLMGKPTLKIPEKIREKLKSPFGVLLKKETVADFIKKNDSHFIVTVGDITSQYFVENKLTTNIKIIDHKNQRQEIKNIFFKQLSSIKAVNKPGYLYPAAVLSLKNAIDQYLFNKKDQMVTIEGEEDLLVLPAILLSPLGSLVFYGQPEKGIVGIVVTEEKKEETRKLLEQFVPMSVNN